MITRANLRDKRDGELLRLYVEQHSEDAFTQLGQRYANLVYATCLREMGEPTAAEDAAQAVFLLLSQKAALLCRYETLAGWLYRASCYTCRNTRRQQRRRQWAERNAVLEEKTVPSAENELWERIEPHFHAALNRLKPADQEAILLRYGQALSLPDVGTALGITENTARMRVSRALEKIRAHLAKAGGVMGVAVLAAVLEKQTGRAAPPSVLASVGQIAREKAAASPMMRSKVPNSLATLPMGTKAASIALCALLLVGIPTFQWLKPRRLSIAEQRQWVKSLSASDWQGTLTFADDQTGKRFTYPTRVHFRTQAQGAGLERISTYTGSAKVDTLRFVQDSRTDVVTVRNEDARGSYTLSALGALLRERNGSVAFQGSGNSSIFRDARVRIRFVQTGNALTIREEYRQNAPVNAFSRYTFRNQYALRRAP